MRVIVADDSRLLWESVDERLRERGHPAARWAPSLRDLVSMAAADPPDLVLLDMRMPATPGGAVLGQAGAIAARHLRIRRPDLPILVMSGHTDVPLIEEILRLGGAVGFQSKDAGIGWREVVGIMERVCAGAVHVDAGTVELLMQQSRSAGAFDALTAAEEQVLLLIAQARTNKAIAGELHYTEKSVEDLVGSIYRKLRFEGDRRQVNLRVRAALDYLQDRRTMAVCVLEVVGTQADRSNALHATVRCLIGRAATADVFLTLTETGPTLVEAELVSLSANGRPLDHLDPGRAAEAVFRGRGAHLIGAPCTLDRDIRPRIR
ncbi:response regulator transcription factor [Dactylosporangium darangshiense]|uniref:Response regulatory domain-containing protein n=1 Tax=Dactylosporangium darangshiense TaxID=579108 RepID=A0ABP8DMF4_9ACTN